MSLSGSRVEDISLSTLCRDLLSESDTSHSTMSTFTLVLLRVQYNTERLSDEDDDDEHVF